MIFKLIAVKSEAAADPLKPENKKSRPLWRDFVICKRRVGENRLRLSNRPAAVSRF